MVWFQCEDCGENLKKPKLANHFRICSAFKLSCIDCGETFGQQSVQGHTQCITEAEKYGPKGQVKASNASKPKSDSKQKPDIDINVGLSQRPPWFCSLCNTSATSQQTLLLHAEGKKHRGKARAFHAKQQPNPTEESAPNTNVPTENTAKVDSLCKKDVEVPKEQDPPKVATVAENGIFLSKKKRKLNASENENGRSNEEMIQDDTAEETKVKVKVKKAKNSVLKEDKEDAEVKIKWKKLITRALKSNPDGVLKMRKLKKLVLEAIREFFIANDESELINTIERKINSSSRFAVDNEYVRLVSKD